MFADSHQALQGYTLHKPGSSTWHRINRPKAKVLNSHYSETCSPSERFFGIPRTVSPGASPARSVTENLGDHDPWCIHSPSPAGSLATHDSR